MFILKTIYKVKIIDLKKNRLYKVSSKVATYVWNTFYSKIMRWQKVSHEDKKNWKSANLPKCTDPLKGVVVAKWGSKNKFSNLIFMPFFMKIWKITSILVLVLFWYMARKALFDEFKNISYEKSWNFLIFGNLKHDLQKNESEI